MPAFKDLTDQRFGKLVVLSRAPSQGKGAFWNVRCDCGTEKILPASPLSRGHAKSCGCGIAESNARRAKHGAAARKKGGSNPNRAYIRWVSVRQRCTNPNDVAYHRYGGRGIIMHPEWAQDFTAFFRDVGEPPTSKHTLERINNDRGYEPGNVCWATRKEQANNRSTNVMVTHLGKTQNLTQWSKELGITYATLRGRIQKGVTDPDKLLRPQVWVRGDTKVLHNGESKTLAELSKETGVNYQTLRWRHKHGKPLI